jgi:hypothetical protein
VELLLLLLLPDARRTKFANVSSDPYIMIAEL